MLRFFPFEEEFDPGMGMRLLKAHEPVCDIESGKYPEEVALKAELLEAAPDYYFHGGSATFAAQWDVVELVARNLSRVYPESFRLRCEGDRWEWDNAMTGTGQAFTFGDPATLPMEPLDWIGRQVQDDLVLLDPEPSAAFVGGQLCFANGWAISDRLGKSFLDIHHHTPQATMPSVHTGARFLETLKPGRTFWRMSWNFKLSEQMDMTTRHKPTYKADFARRAPTLTARDVGEAVFIRIERQTFTRLPRSNGILFGIHTYNSTLREEASDRGRARCILNVIRGAPREVKDYKAITPIESAMTQFLEAAIA